MSAVHADRDGSEPRARNYGDALSSFIHQTKELAKKDRQVVELKAENARLQAALNDAEAAEAKVARVEALRDLWLEDGENDNIRLEDVARDLTSALAGRFPEGG